MLEKDFDDDENNNEDKKRPPRRDETWATTREHMTIARVISLSSSLSSLPSRVSFCGCGFWCTEASFANGAAELCFRLLCNIKCTNINLIHVHLHTSKSI